MQKIVASSEISVEVMIQLWSNYRSKSDVSEKQEVRRW